MGEESKVLNLDLDYGRKLGKKTMATGEEVEETELNPSNVVLTVDYINFAAQQSFPQGIETGSKGRLWARLSRRLDDAAVEGVKEVAISEPEIDFLKEIFKDKKFPVNVMKYVVVLVDHIESL
jgi:hypothetical protein